MKLSKRLFTLQDGQILVQQRVEAAPDLRLASGLKAGAYPCESYDQASTEACCNKKKVNAEIYKTDDGLYFCDPTAADKGTGDWDF